jgi:hypothetical protein
MARTRLNLGCTIERHRALGVHAVVNARSGRQDLNDLTIQDVEQMRDARNIYMRRSSRVRFYQWNSRAFQRRSGELAHLVSDYREL